MLAAILDSGDIARNCGGAEPAGFPGLDRVMERRQSQGPGG